MMNSANATVRETGSSVWQTIKQNPLPAAMAGIGIGWLLMNRSSGRSRSWERRWDRDRAWDRDWDGGRFDSTRSNEPGLRDRAGEAMDQVGQTVGQVGEQAGRVAGDVRSTVGDLPDQFGSTARDVGWNAQRLIEDNPLAVGAVAVAVGAAIGMALPETEVERNVLGPAADRAIDQAERAASQAVEELEASTV